MKNKNEENKEFASIVKRQIEQKKQISELIKTKNQEAIDKYANEKGIRFITTLPVK